MTYCVAIKVKDGLIALADGRITAGTQMTSAKKLSLFGEGPNRFFIMTSGLRSIRDKAFAYLQQELDTKTITLHTMLDTVGAYTRQLRRVEMEDREHIEKSFISFDLHSIVGGMMEGDSEPRIFLVYPQGNWIEVEAQTPYLTIGSVHYGKPILDRTLTYDTDMQNAIKIAYLSFDSTKFSSSDVGFPIDIVTMRTADRSVREVHLHNEDAREMREWWNENITHLVAKTPNSEWIAKLLPGQTGE